jgi:DNA-directed RNA polymerase subunit RPC12/RpoP
MIRFECTGCTRKLSVAEPQAGKLVACPSCKTKVRVPAAELDSPEEPDPPLKTALTNKPTPAKEVDFVEPIDDEEERPAPRVRKKTARRRDEDEDFHDEAEEGGFNANRIRGVVAIVMSIVLLVFALTFEKFKDPVKWPMGEYGTPVCCTLAGVLFVAGIFYLIRG